MKDSSRRMGEVTVPSWSITECPRIWATVWNQCPEEQVLRIYTVTRPCWHLCQWIPLVESETLARWAAFVAQCRNKTKQKLFLCVFFQSLVYVMGLNCYPQKVNSVMETTLKRRSQSPMSFIGILAFSYNIQFVANLPLLQITCETKIKSAWQK